MLDGAIIFMITRVLVGAFLLWLLYRLVRSCVFVIRGNRERAKFLRDQIIGFTIAFISLWHTGIRLHPRYRSQMLYGIRRPFGRASMLALLLLCVLFLNSACTSGYPKLADVSEQEFPVVFSIAEQLGYTEDDLLVQANHCGATNLAPPPFPRSSSCGIFVAFETALPLNEFGSLVAQLEFERMGTYKRYGKDLFTFLNLSNHITEYRRLTVEGNDGWGEGKRELLPDIFVQYWNFKYKSTQFLDIDFYGTAELDPHIDLGEESIEGNIIVVYLHLGTVQTWPE